MARFERPRTISEGVYDHLREELFAGRLEPGAWLREQELAEGLRVSRTPVREAVRRLAQEGFLRVVPNRGAQVRHLTLTEAVDVYEVRDRLEGMAARLAAEHAGPDDVATLREQLRTMASLEVDDFVGQIRADNDFHLGLATLSGNEVLSELVGRLNERVTRAKIVTRDVNSSALARSQHATIVDAIARGDGEAAARAMRRHVRTNLEVLKERLARGLGVAAASDGEDA